MRKLIFLFCLILIAGFSFAEGILEKARNEYTDTSYAFGMIIASDLEQLGMKFDYNAFSRGFREMSEGRETLFTMDEAIEIISGAIQAAAEEQARTNRLSEEIFLRENTLRPGIYVTPSGLQYEILVEGTGRQPYVSDTVIVHYQGCLVDGNIFDSSYERGLPETVPLQAVIPGWSEGLTLMREGGKSRLYIPSALAYGEMGAGDIIPPYSVIIFEIELIEIADM